MMLRREKKRKEWPRNPRNNTEISKYKINKDCLAKFREVQNHGVTNINPEGSRAENLM
jgi:hypothetical protein